MSELIRIATPKKIIRFAGRAHGIDGMDYSEAIDNLTKQGYKFGELHHFLVYSYLSTSGPKRNIFLTIVREAHQDFFGKYDREDKLENLEDMMNIYLNSLDRTMDDRILTDTVPIKLLSLAEIHEQDIKKIEKRKPPYTMLTFPDGVERLEKVVRAIDRGKYEIKIVKRPK